MNKAQLLERINNHHNFNPDRLKEISNGRRLTNTILFQYLCELEKWKPLEVVASSDPDWVFVASTSQIDKWHRASILYHRCTCSEYPKPVPCCHLSSAMAAEENQWIAQSEKYGFKVKIEDGVYSISDRITVGKLSFEGDHWVLVHRERIHKFESATEAIEYLASVASFGWQFN